MGSLTVLLCVLLTALVLTFPITQWSAESIPLITRYVYRLDCKGMADVTVLINATNLDYVKFYLEPGFINGTLTAYTENGTPLYLSITKGMVTIYTYRQVKMVIAEYLAQVGNVSEEVVINATIHPQGPASVFLPQGTALTYVSGNPDINFMNGSIVLLFSKPGTYVIEYAVIPPMSTAVTTSGAILSTRTPTTISKTSNAHLLTSSRSNNLPSQAQQYLPFIVFTLIIAVVVAIMLIRLLRRRSAIIEPEVTVGLDDRDLAILSALIGGELSLSDIARKIGFNKSVVWRRVNRMVREGYLERRVVKGRTMYRLTEKGLRVVSKEH